jgi:RNA polymerase sigma-70 factor (ECF subfamily)
MSSFLPPGSNASPRLPDDFPSLLRASRDGSREAVGELLEQCRPYLLSIAARELEKDLNGKASASDVVQDTFLEAHSAFPQFVGQSERELLGWLRQILVHNLVDLRREYRNTGKRDIARECPIEGGTPGADLRDLVPADTTSPSGKAIHQEEELLLQEALGRLPDDYRQVLTMRHKQYLSFGEIGDRMARSADAARMLWYRAFEALAAELENRDGRRPD